MKFFTDLDLRNNELQNAVIENLAEAPESASAGRLFYNSTANKLVWYDGTEWRSGAVEGITVDGTEIPLDAHGFIELIGVLNGYLNKSGDEMSGIIDMGNNAIVNVANPVDNKDAANKSWVLDVIGSLGTVLVYKGVVDTYDELPVTGNKNGDVWLVRENTAEYVFTDGEWEMFGPIIDLTPYLRISDLAATTGSSTTTAMTQAATSTALAGKVDVIEGKGLSENDYTDEDKTKLDNIEAGATHVIVDPALNSMSANPVENRVITQVFDRKVDKVDGKDLSSNDYTTEEKTKLAGIEAEANKTIVDSALSTTSTNPLQNRVVNSALETKVDKVYGKGLSTNDYTNADKAKLDSIPAGAEPNQNAFSIVKVDNVSVSADTPTDTLNLFAGTNVQINANAGEDGIAISATDTTYDLATTSTSGLMSALDKIKLNSMSQGATATAFVRTLNAGTKIGEIIIDGVSISIFAPPNYTYTLTQNQQDGHIITLSSSGGESVTITIPDNDTTYDPATTTTDGLLSASDKTKLDGIEAGATHIVVDNTLDNTSTNPVQNRLIVNALNTKADLLSPEFVGVPKAPNISASSIETAIANKKYVDEQINGLGTLLRFKGTKARVADLPVSGEIGDVWIVLEDGGEYVWAGVSWERFGPVIDLSGYLEIANLAGSVGQSTITAMTQKATTDALNTKVSNVAYANKKLTQTINGVVTDVVAISTIKTDLALVKGDVGLGNVDNTSDLNKPISTATQNALNDLVASAEDTQAIVNIFSI